MPLFVSIVIFIEFCKIKIGKLSVVWDVMNNLNSSWIDLIGKSLITFSNVGSQDEYRWQFYKTIQSPCFIPWLSSEFARFSVPLPKLTVQILSTQFRLLDNSRISLLGSAPLPSMITRGSLQFICEYASFSKVGGTYANLSPRVSATNLVTLSSIFSSLKVFNINIFWNKDSSS